MDGDGSDGLHIIWRVWRIIFADLLHEEDSTELDVDVNPLRAGAWAVTKDEEHQEDDDANQNHKVPAQQPRVAIEDAEDHEDDEADHEQQPM